MDPEKSTNKANNCFGCNMSIKHLNLPQLITGMRRFGLIGRQLAHSFSKDYFEKKWASSEINDCSYELFPIPDKSLLKTFLDANKHLNGLNVTIPYKQSVIEFMDQISPEAKEIGAVNCLHQEDGQWVGYNTDGPAFLNTLMAFLSDQKVKRALILGTGGASRAVQWALHQLSMDFDLVSSSGNGISYQELDANWKDDWNLVIQTSPVGMYPKSDSCPAIPYHRLNHSYFLYDLIYNPEETEFMRRGRVAGAKVKNGLQMLYDQADLSWQIWNMDSK